MPISADAQQLLEILPPTGRITNQTGTKKTGWDYDRLIQAKFELRDAGHIEIRKGWGGPFGKLPYVPAAQVPAAQLPTAQLESELYAPFEAWVRAELLPDDFQDGKDFFQVVVSANRRPPNAGTWEIPDLVSVSLKKYPYLPQVEFVASSFELKKQVDAFNVYGVFEAVSHSKFAHRSYYVFEFTDDNFEKRADYQRVLQEATVNGLGLLRIKFADAAKTTLSVDELLEPRTRQPQSSALSGLIDIFFEEESKKRIIERTAHNLFW